MIAQYGIQLTNTVVHSFVNGSQSIHYSTFCIILAITSQLPVIGFFGMSLFIMRSSISSRSPATSQLLSSASQTRVVDRRISRTTDTVNIFTAWTDSNLWWLCSHKCINSNLYQLWWAQYIVVMCTRDKLRVDYVLRYRACLYSCNAYQNT